MTSVSNVAGAAARTTDSIACFDPATLEPLGEVPVFDEAAVLAAVERARRAAQTWAYTSFAERRALLRRLLHIVLRDADELCDLLVRDAGKTRENAMLGEIWPVAEKLRATISHGERFLKPERVSAGLLLHKKATIHYEPRGVIGVICPWNYPLQNVLGPTVPALMAGNAVVVKVSEWTSYSAARIAAIFHEALSAEGLPTDLVQIITGYGDTGRALVQSGADQIIFTGSMPNGRRVLASSAERLTPTILELGGKDALIVCDDAHLEQAAHAALAGVFITAGQSCLAAERILVFDAVYDAFRERVADLARQLTQGSAQGGAPVDVGAMTSPHQVDVVERLVNDAVSRGAKVVVGGKRNAAHRGQFFEPTVLAEVTEDMAIMQEETFGPVLVLARVQDEADAIRLTNATPYGLGCTIMTKSRARGARMAAAVRTGSVGINDFGLAYMAGELPFGGTGGSGFGRLNGREGLRACCNLKAVLSDRLPLHWPTKLFPVSTGDYELARGAIRLIYGRGLRERWAAIRSLVGRGGGPDMSDRTN